MLFARSKVSKGVYMRKFSLKKLYQGGVVALSAMTLFSVAGVGVVSAQSNGDNNGRRDNNSWRDRQGGWHWNWNDNDEEELTCEERQDWVNQKVASYKTKATDSYNRLNLYYQAHKSYVEAANLDVENAENLVARADRSSTKTLQAIEDLEAPEVDCERSQRKDAKLVEEAKWPVKDAMHKFLDRTQNYVFAIWEEIV